MNIRAVLSVEHTMPDLLSADTAMGAVTLFVADLDVQTAYYRDAVTLEVLSATDATVTLGRGSIPVVVLEHRPGLSPAALGSAGLFHTAILFDSQAELAAALYSVATRAPGTFTGSADHLVSEAFYFTDPEGNGVELYTDRERSTWSWAHGQIEVASLALDPDRFISDHLTDSPTGSSNAGNSTAGDSTVGGPTAGSSTDGGPTAGDSTVGGPTAGSSTDGGDRGGGRAAIGHVHLSVGDVASAREFYVDRLGFETTAALSGSALFVSAGGYHHHMAMNTWNSRGAGPRTRALGLGRVDIVLPTADDVGAVRERMRHHRIAVRDDGLGLSLDDPWANTIRVSTR